MAPATLEAAPSATAVAARVATVETPNGTLVAEFDAYHSERIVCITWHGHLTSESVVQVATEGLRLRQKGRSTPFVINDKSRSTGEWDDAMPWLEYEWLPQTVAGGLRAMAYVVSDDMHTYMASFAFYQRIRETLPLQLFSSVAEARQWLLSLHEPEAR